MTNAETPTPEQIKKRIQDVYLKAISDRFSSRSRSGSEIDHLVQAAKLYGRDAGVDFIETHLPLIAREACEVARCKEKSLTLPTYGYGRSAMVGMVEKLRELTALKAEVNASTVVLTWAEANPGLV